MQESSAASIEFSTWDSKINVFGTPSERNATMGQIREMIKSLTVKNKYCVLFILLLLFHDVSKKKQKNRERIFSGKIEREEEMNL